MFRIISVDGTKVTTSLARHALGSVTMTNEVGTDGATTLSRMNLSGYVGHVTISSSMFTIACCLVVGLGLELDLVSGW